MRIRTILFSAFIGMASALSAQSLAEAKEAFSRGDYAEALPVLKEHAAKEPRNAALQQMTGIAMMYTGNEAGAVHYLEKGTNEANIYLARIAFNRYDFERAEELLEKYEKAQKKARKPVDEEVELLREKISLGTSMLDRVEKIVIIDSMTVDRENFFKYYKLAPSAGYICEPSEVLPDNFEVAVPSSVYLTESKESMIWVTPDSDENFVLMSSTRLADDSWEKPMPLGDNLNNGGDANYPFMMSDGVTLYYASDGENSLGGYDIFLSRRDGDTFFQPQNVGLPYNSPYDDYLLAIDEETGVGWWATDRNRIPDKVTIYRFIPQELRINYPVDHEDLASRALITSYRDTWEPGADYSQLLAKVDNLGNGSDEKSVDFSFPLPGGRIYHSVDDFKSASARKLMTDYLNFASSIEAKTRRLAMLRRAYASGDTSYGEEILALEKELPNMKAELVSRANDIIKAEN